MTDIFFLKQLDGWINEGGTGDASPPAEPLNILVIEDDAMIAMLYAELLAQIGHQVCGMASTENEAVAMAERLLPELIIADLGLRQGSGIAALQRILHLRDVPYLFVTGANIDLMPLRAHARMLRKPFSEDQLVSAIAGAISGSANPAAQSH